MYASKASGLPLLKAWSQPANWRPAGVSGMVDKRGAKVTDRGSAAESESRVPTTSFPA
jgi:hypothetical protein